MIKIIDPMETWKLIPGFEDEYEVSDLGRIRSIRRALILKPCDNRGYNQVVLCVNQIKYDFKVYRLVIITFKGVNLKKTVVNHINGNKKDDRLVNLEWTTYSENINHSIHTIGNKHGGKLTQKKIVEIKELIGSKSYLAISKVYKVSPPTISKIARGITWKTITDNIYD